MNRKLRNVGIAVAVLVAVVGGALFAISRAFADICETVVLNDPSTASRRLTAYVYGGDCGAVATITTTTVVVGPPGIVDPHHNDQVVDVLRVKVAETDPRRSGNYGPPVEARWADDSTLVLTYHSGLDVRYALLRTSEFRVMYDTLP